ncbi:hypothetical protein H4R19_001699 [Coemansia spiralis]|nr:hypothetical protein H4R19_001699 [Coemansia spiralis]
MLLLPSALGKVKMDVYAMSKCPETWLPHYGLNKWGLQLLVYDNENEVDLRFNYIGKLNNTSKYGVECLHGDIGKHSLVKSLCVQKNADASTTLQFVLCQNNSPRRIGGYALFAECLRAVPNWYAAIRCATGSEGTKLLQNSVSETQHSDIKTSLTLALNGQKRCIYDSGHWVTPKDGCPGGGSVPLFGKSIRELGAGQQPQQQPAPSPAQ